MVLSVVEIPAKVQTSETGHDQDGYVRFKRSGVPQPSFPLSRLISCILRVDANQFYMVLDR
jgi:hypothetical protein